MVFYLQTIFLAKLEKYAKIIYIMGYNTKKRGMLSCCV